MSNQPRAPRGVPTGGQFSYSEKPEVPLSLPADGSFFYPPMFRTADEVIAFWSTVEIPDEALARTEKIYAVEFAATADNSPAALWGTYGAAEWGDDNPCPDGDKRAEVKDWERRMEAARVVYEARLQDILAARPKTLDRRDIRPLVRAAGMLSSASALDVDSYYAVRNHEISLVDGPATVHDAVCHTGVMGFSSRILEPDGYDLSSEPKVGARAATTAEVRQIVNEVVSKHIRQQNRALDGALDELTDNLGTVGNTIIDVYTGEAGRRGYGR